MLDDLTNQPLYLDKISQYIRGVRRQLGYTRLQLAEELGITVELLISVENAEEDTQTASQLFNQVRIFFRNRPD